MNDDLFFFKLKKNYLTGFEVFEIAKNILGQPVSINYSENFSGISSEIEFAFHNSRLTIDKPWIGELSFNLKQEPFSRTDSCSWQIKFKEFANQVKKPWFEWTEEEILCDPMWIYFFFESNRDIPDHFHNAMVLFSYKDTKNTWIKRYFNAKDKEKFCSAKDSY